MKEFYNSNTYNDIQYHETIYHNNIRKLKKALRKAQQSKKGKQQDHIIQAHQAYLDQAKQTSFAA